jgi:hypothetical protein
MEKLEMAQRELKHMHTSLKATWAMLDVEQRKFIAKYEWDLKHD